VNIVRKPETIKASEYMPYNSGSRRRATRIAQTLTTPWLGFHPRIDGKPHPQPPQQLPLAFQTSLFPHPIILKTLKPYLYVGV